MKMRREGRKMNGNAKGTQNGGSQIENAEIGTQGRNTMTQSKQEGRNREETQSRTQRRNQEGAHRLTQTQEERGGKVIFSPDGLRFCLLHVAIYFIQRKRSVNRCGAHACVHGVRGNCAGSGKVRVALLLHGEG